MGVYDELEAKYRKLPEKYEGKNFRQHIRRPMPSLRNIRHPPPEVRVVPPFSTLSRQKNVVVSPPPTLREIKEKEKQLYKSKPRKSKFPEIYMSGSLPLFIVFARGGPTIKWMRSRNDLDILNLLAAFFEGLPEPNYPYNFVAKAAILDLLKYSGADTVTVLPRVIIHLKRGLKSGDYNVACSCLEVIKELIRAHPDVGPALVPFYRQFLGPFNGFIKRTCDMGDATDFSQVNFINIAESANETLTLLDEKGGPFAYINIKYLVPNYERR